jgi:hypothetical protein
MINQQIDSGQQAILKAAPALVPGAVTGIASYLNVIETSLSIALLALSIAYLVWRWIVAYRKDKDPKN